MGFPSVAVVHHRQLGVDAPTFVPEGRRMHHAAVPTTRSPTHIQTVMVAGYVALSPLTAWTGRHRFNLGELGMVPAGGANFCGAEYKVGSGREALHHQIVIATVCFPLVALDARLGLTLLLMTHR